MRGAHTELATGTPAYVARPDATVVDDVELGVVLWPDIFGLRPLFVDHANRLCEEFGWTVVVVEPFPKHPGLADDDRFDAAAELSDADKLADTAAAIELCGTRVNATLGFCMGGMWALKSLATPDIDRAVSFYGMVRMPVGWRSPRLHDAIEVMRERAADVLALFGTDDPWCPDEDQAELAAAGAAVVRYPEAGHGWAQDPARDNYRPDDAADAWRRAERFLSAVVADR